MLRRGFAFAGEHEFKRVLVAVLVAEVEVGEFVSGLGEGVEVRRERDARQFLRQIIGELRPVFGSVENAVDVVENLVLRDGIVTVVAAERQQRVVRDVVDTVRPSSLLSHKLYSDMGLDDSLRYDGVSQDVHVEQGDPDPWRIVAL